MRLLLSLILLPSVLLAQSASVQPDRFLSDRRGGIAPCPVFTINTIDSTLFGANKQPGLRLPATAKNSVEGFAFIACPFTPQGYTPEQRSFIYFTNIGQPGMSAYVDRNFNYDYTDDGLPVTADANGVVAVALASPEDPATVMEIHYTLLNKSMNVSNLPEQLFANNAYYTGVVLMEKNSWFSAEQLWIKGKDIVIGADSVCVTFFDRDVDGCFTGAQDMIALLPYGADSAYTSKYNGVRALEPGLILRYKDHAYEINCDTTRCQPVTLTLRPDLLPPVTLSAGDPLPHFSVQFFDRDSADIYTVMQPGKYTYIEFWGMWCAGCRLVIPDLKNMNDTLSDRLTIISLDAYDNRERARAFVKENQMTWLQGFSNTQIENLLYAGDGFPYGVLVDPNGYIVAFNVSPRQVAEMIPAKK